METDPQSDTLLRTCPVQDIHAFVNVSRKLISPIMHSGLRRFIYRSTGQVIQTTDQTRSSQFRLLLVDVV